MHFIKVLLRDFWRGGSFGTRERLIKTSTSSLMISIAVEVQTAPAGKTDQADVPGHLHLQHLLVCTALYLQVEVRTADMHAWPA